MTVIFPQIGRELGALGSTRILGQGYAAKILPPIFQDPAGKGLIDLDLCTWLFALKSSSCKDCFSPLLALQRWSGSRHLVPGFDSFLPCIDTKALRAEGTRLNLRITTATPKIVLLTLNKCCSFTAVHRENRHKVTGVYPGSQWNQAIRASFIIIWLARSYIEIFLLKNNNKKIK